MLGLLSPIRRRKADKARKAAEANLRAARLAWEGARDKAAEAKARRDDRDYGAAVLVAKEAWHDLLRAERATGWGRA